MTNLGAAEMQQRARHVLYAVFFLLAIFLPRVVQLDSFFIQDEHLWLDRAQIYSEAMLRWDIPGASTFELSNHPAITLMSVVGPVMTTYGHVHDLTGTFANWSVADRRSAAAWGRLSMGVAASVLLVVLYMLLRQLSWFTNDSWAPAFITIMLGLEPWVLGITRTVIVDTLMALFLILCVVTGALARERNNYRWYLLAGAWWGLAFISKSPALIVLPIAWLVPVVNWPRAWREMARTAGWWLLGAYGAMVIFWPPFFFHPLTRIKGVLARDVLHATTPEAYLWPGWHPPLFLYVLSASALIGCICYVIIRLKDWRQGRGLVSFDALLIGGLLFGSVLLYLHGDHARKDVPVIALLAVVGAIGWVLLLKKLKVYSPATLLGVLALQVALVFPWFPHLPSFHDQLLPFPEGNRLLVDVGNGSRLLADYLTAAPADTVLATNLPNLMQYYVSDDVRTHIRRLPAEGKLNRLGAEVTHIAIPASFPARVGFDPISVALTHEVEGLVPETTIRFRDVTLFNVYNVKDLPRAAK